MGPGSERRVTSPPHLELCTSRPPQDFLPFRNLAPSQPPTALSTLQALLKELRTPNSSPGPPVARAPPELQKDEMGFREVSKPSFSFGSVHFNMIHFYYIQFSPKGSRLEPSPLRAPGSNTEAQGTLHTAGT